MFFRFFADRAKLYREARERKEQAFRPGTRANHRSHAVLFVAFSLHFQLRDFPAETATLLCFMEFLLRSYRSPKSVLNALASVRRTHLQLRCSTAAFDHDDMIMMKRALPLTTRHVPRPAPPLPVCLLRQLVLLAEVLGEQGQVFAALMAIAFYSMARISSLLPQGAAFFDGSRLPTLRDLVEVPGQGYKLHIKWAKNRQHASDAFWVPLKALGAAPECPVANARRLAQLAEGCPVDTPLFAYRGGPCGTGGSPAGRQVFTIPVARQWLRVTLNALGRGQEGLTFHSFRRGACTVASQHGADEAALQALGGWRSSAVRGYYPAAVRRGRAALVLSRGALPY